MTKSKLPSKEEILAIEKAEREYAHKLLVAQENFKLVREELAHCYMENGVNHKMACKALREEYAALLRDPYMGAGPPVSYIYDVICFLISFNNSFSLFPIILLDYRLLLT
jgi:hypothetical protein